MSGSLLHRLASPARFQRWADQVWPGAVLAAALFLSVGLYWGLFVAPADYQQGDTVRIMYIHVPAAIMAQAIYGLLALCGLSSLIWRHVLADIIGRAAAPLGAGFTALALISGALWGKPTWGTYWVWDARLTSFLVLLFLYGGYILLIHAFDRPERGSRLAAILAAVGAINLPIIKYSVDWWNTLHQPASLTLRNSAIDSQFLTPLLLTGGGFLCYFVAILILRVKIDLIRTKLRHRHWD